MAGKKSDDAEGAGTAGASEEVAAPAEEPVAEVVTEVPNEGTLREKLTALGVSEEAIAKLESEELTTEDALRGFSYEQFTAMGIKAGSAKKLVEAFEPTQAAVSALATADAPSMNVLPDVPDDTSFLEMLKVGGVLKVTTTDVISAMRAKIASGVGLYDLPKTILAKFEAFADEQAEPVGKEFFDLQKLVTQRGYGDLLSALGVPGNFVSDRRKVALLSRLDSSLWPALSGFQTQLVAWTDAWSSTMANPAMALTFLAMAQTGAKGVMPPGMLQPPETAGLRDEAEAVIDKINKVFAGVGIPVARALAYDATRIKGILEDPTLPAAMGVTSREQMLRALGVEVGSDYVRLERNVTRYALAIMELPKVSSGNEEYGYLGAMLQLGAQIPWDKLSKGGRPGTGGGFRDDDEDK